MSLVKKYGSGIILAVILSYIAIFISSYIPKGLISPGVFSLLIGMALNPFTRKFDSLKAGVKFTSKGV